MMNAMTPTEKTLEQLMEEIRLYQPWTDKETWEKQQILDFMEKNPDCLVRGNRIAHMTVSSWVVNPERTKVLMAYHKIYDSWAWLGGHADGCADLLAVAVKEACEEAGLMPDIIGGTGPLQGVRPVSREIFSLETLTVDGHMKRGQWVPSHLHLNLTYLLEAPEDAALKINEEENSGVAWFTFEEALKASKEPWFIEHIYSKLIRKVKWRT